MTIKVCCFFGWVGLAALCAGVQEDENEKVQETEARPRFKEYRHGFNPDTLALQVLLDRKNISCNCIDGVWGPRTEIALMTWELLQKRTPTGIPTAELLDELGGTTNVLFSYTVTHADYEGLSEIPESWVARAAMPAMNHTTVQERLAERAHASMRALERLNPAVTTWPNPPAGTALLLPDCTVPKADKKIRAGSIRISLSRREVTVFDAKGRLVALFPCSIARNKARRPEGELSVKNIAPNPIYVYDPKLFSPEGTETAKLIIPAGPNNPVGLAWIGLSLQGYGIHGTPIPEQIGQAVSKGCFRLANWNALKLVDMVEIGTPIFIEE